MLQFRKSAQNYRLLFRSVSKGNESNFVSNPVCNQILESGSDPTTDKSLLPYGVDLEYWVSWGGIYCESRAEAFRLRAMPKFDRLG